MKLEVLMLLFPLLFLFLIKRRRLAKQAFGQLRAPLFSSKRANFLDFEEVAHMIQVKEHLTQEGLDKIQMIKANMNSKRSFSDPEVQVNFMNSTPKGGSIKLNAGWISGFIDAEGYFGIFKYVSNTHFVAYEYMKSP